LGTVYGATPAGTATVAIGYQAASTTPATVGGTAIGYQALTANTTGSRNTVVGSGAMAVNTTGNYNVAMGYQNLGQSNSDNNTAVGYNVLASLTSGSSNTGVGFGALQTSTTAGNNTAVGYQALNLTTGVENTAVGYQALVANTTGTDNTAIGLQAASLSQTGSNNVFVGVVSGANKTSGDRCVYIGLSSNGSSATVSREFVLNTTAGVATGKGADTGFMTCSGGIYQGNNSAAWSVTSDQRLKKNIVDNDVGLDAINAIRVRNFEYRLPEEVDSELDASCAIAKPGVQLGVIAQELQAVLPDCVKQESTGVLSVDSDSLTWHMINAIKQLSARVAELEAKVV
jgi:hypothetical protein